MAEIEFGRLRDLGGLPDLVHSLAGEEALHRAFRDQGLPIALLDAPDAPVPMRDIVALYHRAAEITGMRSFGLQASRDIDASQHGVMGLYLTQARNLPCALHRFRAALPYYETGSSLEIEVSGNELLVGYRNVYQDLVGWRHVGDFTLCIVADLIDSYLGDTWTPIRIEMCCAKGHWDRDYEEHFGVPIVYDQPRVAIVLDREMARSAGQSHADDRGPRISLGDIRRMGDSLPRDFPHAVANIVERRLLERKTDLDGTAALLCLGPRTLQRRLDEHGLSYRELALRCRMRRARELLAESDITVREVGRAAGYGSTPQFTRAFKMFSGRTPDQFRQSVLRPLARQGEMASAALAAV